MTAKVARLEDKIRGARLQWFGHVRRREEGYVGRMLEMEIRVEEREDGYRW